MTALPTVYQNEEDTLDIPIYYVYTHIDPETKELLYVGQGSKGRAWVYAQGHLRKPHHDAYLMKLTEKGFTPDSWVHLVETQLTKEQSCLLETKLIWEAPTFPRFNSRRGHCCVLSQENLDKITELRNTGLSYADIADEISSTTMTVFRAHTGRTKNYV